jgi:hypothetical protein
MRVQQAVLLGERVALRQPQGSARVDFLAVITICMIFGLQILTVMQSTGGPEAYSLVASEGMQSR